MGMPTKRVTLQPCPSCGSDFAVIELLEHITPSGVRLGRTFMKCQNGCSKRKVLLSQHNPRRKKQIPNAVFMDVISHARAEGKMISMADKERELSIKMAARNQENNRSQEVIY